MKKTLLFFGLISVLSLGLVVSNSNASGMGRMEFRMFDTSKLIGATVEDSNGEFVGVVNDVMADSWGHAFAVVNYNDLYYTGGVDTLVPLQELRISRTKKGQDIASLKTGAESENQPYWIEGGTAGKVTIMGLNSLNLVGAAVEDSCGKVVGIVNEVMVDFAGRAFAIVNHGDYDLYGKSGVNTPVPLQEVRISQTQGSQGIAFLKTDMEHLDFAPYLNPIKKGNRKDWSKVYEYYGIQPHWTQAGGSSK